MRCPFCEHTESKVIDSRPNDDFYVIRRRRECIACGKRFTTYEKIEMIPIIVIKHDHSREPYDRMKLINGIMHACVKRPISMAKIESIVNHIEAYLSNSLTHEVESSEIGRLVMKALKDLDEIAYVRFASVYKKFQDVGMFQQEVSSLNEPLEKQTNTKPAKTQEKSEM